MSNPESGDVRLQQTVTAFVDLLGLSNALERLDRIVDEDMDKDAALLLVQQSIGNVRKLRRLFSEAIRAQASRATEAPTNLPEDVAALWSRSLKYDLRFVAFSDCVLLNLPIERDNLLATCRGILSLFHTLSFAVMEMMLHGQLVRGGIDAGVAFGGTEQELLGSGLVHAYRIETKIAKHPRICVGPRFMGMLTAIQKESAALPPKEMDLVDRHVGRIRSLLVIDKDGVQRLQFDSGVLVEWLRAAGREHDYEKALSCMDAQLATLSPERDGDVVEKIKWIRNELALAATRMQQGVASFANNTQP